MSPFLRLVDLALHVDELLMRPASMAAARQLVESYRVGLEQGTIEAIPFPINPEELPYESIDGVAVPTPAQGAAALVALRDARCPGVEKIIPIPAALPALEEAMPKDREERFRDWRRAVSWTATLTCVRNLEDYALPWFTLQMRRFERSLPSGDAGDETRVRLAPAHTAPWEGDDWEALEPQVRQLLLFMHGREKADLRELCPKVWGKDYADVSDAARETATSKANKFLNKREAPHFLAKVRKEPFLHWV